jgi:transaldolase
MKLFADTANVREIREIASWGILDGATTNPTLLSREEGDPYDIMREICEIVGGPVSAEVVTEDSVEMIEQGRKLSKIHQHIVVKIPFGSEGLKAVRALAEEGVRCNVTLVFSATQALLAAKVGAFIVSPFVGRLDDISHSGIDLASDILTIYENYEYDTQVCVASIRHPGHVLDAALMGAHIATAPPKVLRQLLNHPLTDIGKEKFNADWEKVKGRSK